jgi:hypothetical protein
MSLAINESYACLQGDRHLEQNRITLRELKGECHP